MTQKTQAQMDLADTIVARNSTLNQRLDRIDQIIEWKNFEKAFRLKLGLFHLAPTR
ncbi:MAG: hypothetical protein AB7O96_00790 [Pseudobdellovibrionaceae bacterium]|nr:hypothetical protein [Halobacteriovoraceae bacterium]